MYSKPSVEYVHTVGTVLMSYRQKAKTAAETVFHARKPNPTDDVKLFSLLTDSRKWVHRRVDALRLSTDGLTRRYVSLDFTIPKESMIVLSDDQVVVPIGLIGKNSLRRLDIKDATGRSLSILETSHNAGYAVRFLQAMVPARIVASSNLFTEISDLIDQLVT